MGILFNHLAARVGVDPATLELARELQKGLTETGLEELSTVPPRTRRAHVALGKAPVLLAMAAQAYIEADAELPEGSTPEDNPDVFMAKTQEQERIRRERHERLLESQETSRIYNTLAIGQFEKGDEVVFKLVTFNNAGTEMREGSIAGTINRGDAMDDQTFFTIKSDKLGKLKPGQTFYLQGSGSGKEKDEFDQWAIDEPGLIKQANLLGFGDPGTDGGHWVMDSDSNLARVVQITINGEKMFAPI